MTVLVVVCMQLQIPQYARTCTLQAAIAQSESDAKNVEHIPEHAGPAVESATDQNPQILPAVVSLQLHIPLKNNPLKLIGISHFKIQVKFTGFF